MQHGNCKQLTKTVGSFIVSPALRQTTTLWSYCSPRHSYRRNVLLQRIFVVWTMRLVWVDRWYCRRRLHNFLSLIILETPTKFFLSFEALKTSMVGRVECKIMDECLKLHILQRKFLILDSQWLMVTELGDFVQTEFIKQCLDLNLRPHDVERAHYHCATTQPSRTR